MNKFQQLKQAIANPPPDRLAKTEYQSHFLNILGVFAVCIILITKGFWYIVFALIFSIGVSYSQGITAYRKYLMIKEAMGDTTISVDQDPSPSRRRDRIIKQRFGKWFTHISTLVAIGISFYIYKRDKSKAKCQF